MSMAIMDADWVYQARSIRIESVLTERGILKTLKGRGVRVAGPCPVCGGVDRFGVDLRRNLFNCRHCQRGGGDAIALVMFLDACSFVTAIMALAGPPPDYRGETAEERRQREQRAIERRERLEREKIERAAREAAELRETIHCCDRLWAQTVRLPTSALTYFARRGISLADVPYQGGLRFLARCPFDGPILPCIVARFTDAITNKPGGIWRRPITGEKPKSLGPIKNHVIRLWPDEYVEQGLVVGEGVETVLAAATGITHHNTLLRPAWACGGDDNMRHFPVLSGIESLTILADNDANSAGQDAARDCADRWQAAGRWVEILTPKQIDVDFNDLKMRGEI